MKQSRFAAVTSAVLLLPALLGVGLASVSGWLACLVVAMSYVGGTGVAAFAYRLHSLLGDVRGEVRTLIVEHVVDLEESVT